tara:strand:+ start:381 stop:992 length:612 start_codon:yes stop_codon:yes gene_type:complete
MAKASDDVILRDRMQFELDVAGDRTTLYGRIDLSNYVNPITRQGLAIKEVFFQLRNAASVALSNTGAFRPVANWGSGITSSGIISALKMYATTRAYENASEVGIASPDVICVEEHLAVVGPAHSGANPNDNGAPQDYYTTRYGPKDLHPNGYTVVSDLLIGVAADKWDSLDLDTIEIDVLIIAEPIKVTTDRMNEILSQAQDL